MSHTRVRPPEAVEVLRDEHRRLEALFVFFEGTAVDRRAERVRIWRQVDALLAAHVQAEGGVLYPALERVYGDDRRIGDARETHRLLRDLRRSLEGLSPEDNAHDAGRFDVVTAAVVEVVRIAMDEEEEGLYDLYRRLPPEERRDISAALFAERRELG